MKEERLLTVGEAIQDYGTEKAKNYFNRHRLIGGYTRTLEIALKQHFEEVEVVIINSRKHFKVSGQRSQVADRKEFLHYDNCGGYNKMYPLDFYVEGGLVYMATNKVTGEKYVGSTRQKLVKRIKAHKDQHRDERVPYYTSPIAQAFRKYGFENFEWEIIDFVEEEEALLHIEDLWIINTGAFTKGYNKRLNKTRIT